MSLAAWSSLSSQTPLSFKFPSRTIITKSPITDLIDCGDCVVSGDEAGDIAVYTACEYKETIRAVSTTTTPPTTLLGKPPFFYSRHLDQLAPHEFLALLLAHHFPGLALPAAI